jgi:PAS domain S-box-containing protein
MDDKTIPFSIKQVFRKQEESTVERNPAWDEPLSYRALFEQTGECIFIIGLDFHYITANQQALDLLGYEDNELVNKPVDEVVTQDSSTNLTKPGDEHTQLQERILKRKDGTTVPVEISTTIVYNSDNEPVYIQSVARDISLRKETERMLKRNALILSIISEATARLLQSSDIERKLPSLLESLGQAMNSTCVAIFTVDPFYETPYAEVKYKWSSSSLSDVELATIIEPAIPELLASNNSLHSATRTKTKRHRSSNLAFVSIPIEGAFNSKGYLGFFDFPENSLWSQ